MERTAEVIWVLDHEGDLDADFLAIYGIDLGDTTIAAPRFFALAHRVTAYQGVMAARVEEEREEAKPQAIGGEVRRQDAAPDGSREVTLTAFRVQFPGLVSMPQR